MQTNYTYPTLTRRRRGGGGGGGRRQEEVVVEEGLYLRLETRKCVQTKEAKEEEE